MCSSRCFLGYRAPRLLLNLLFHIDFADVMLSFRGRLPRFEYGRSPGLGARRQEYALRRLETSLSAILEFRA